MTIVDILVIGGKVMVIGGKVIVYGIRTPRGMCLNGGRDGVRQ